MKELVKAYVNATNRLETSKTTDDKKKLSEEERYLKSIMRKDRPQSSRVLEDIKNTKARIARLKKKLKLS